MRLTALLVIVLVLAGCGGGDGPDAVGTTTASTVPCSDQLFRAQDEELYVAQTTAQNALAGPASAELLAQLHQGARLLRAYVDAHPPCADELRTAAETERRAADSLDAGADALAANPGSPIGRAQVTAALADLRTVGTQIRPEAIPGG